MCNLKGGYIIICIHNNCIFIAFQLSPCWGPSFCDSLQPHFFVRSWAVTMLRCGPKCAYRCDQPECWETRHQRGGRFWGLLDGGNGYLILLFSSRSVMRSRAGSMLKFKGGFCTCPKMMTWWIDGMLISGSIDWSTYLPRWMLSLSQNWRSTSNQSHRMPWLLSLRGRDCPPHCGNQSQLLTSLIINNDDQVLTIGPDFYFQNNFPWHVRHPFELVVSRPKSGVRTCLRSTGMQDHL